jgi:hypothetical protein
MFFKKSMMTIKKEWIEYIFTKFCKYAPTLVCIFIRPFFLRKLIPE